MSLRITCLLIGVLSAAPSVGSAQVLGPVSSASPVPIGALVRVTFTPDATDERYFGSRVPTYLVGRMSAIAADTLYLVPVWGAAPVAVPRGRVGRLHVSRGVSSARSSARMALAGALIGLSADLFIYQPAFQDPGPLTARYTIGGAAFGMITGAMWPSESWRRVKDRF